MRSIHVRTRLGGRGSIAAVADSAQCRGVRTARSVALESGVSALPVVAAGRLVGMLTAVDVDKARPSPATMLEVREVRGAMDSVRVDAVIRRRAVFVVPETPLVSAVRLLLDTGLGVLPVVDDARLVGVLDTRDLLAAYVAAAKRAR